MCSCLGSLCAEACTARLLVGALTGFPTLVKAPTRSSTPSVVFIVWTLGSLGVLFHFYLENKIPGRLRPPRALAGREVG